MMDARRVHLTIHAFAKIVIAKSWTTETHILRWGSKMSIDELVDETEIIEFRIEDTRWEVEKGIKEINELIDKLSKIKSWMTVEA